MIVGSLPIGFAASRAAGLWSHATNTAPYSARASCSAQRAIWARLMGLKKKV
jgi:hypothetical protein